MKNALIVGIDNYAEISSLYGCVNDANAVKQVLERHADGSINFAIDLLVTTGPKQYVTESELRAALNKLFTSNVDTVLFYFSGHGYVDDPRGYLMTSECSFGDHGLSLNDILDLAKRSPARNKMIIVDSCSAFAAASCLANCHFSAEIAEGVSLMTASSAENYALEAKGSGLFTSAFIKALKGDAADILGHVTLNSAFANIVRSFSLWEQTPVFKNNIKRLVPLRNAQAPIALRDLLAITELFPAGEAVIQLDPSYLPEFEDQSDQSPTADPKKTNIYRILLKYFQLSLVAPVNSPCLMSAALESSDCQLTKLGEHYRMLVMKQRI